MNQNSKIFVAGHRGLVGSALMRALAHVGFNNIVTRSRADLDLCSQAAVHNFFAAERPEYVFLAAAKVGGIHANRSQPAAFIAQNLMVQTNVIHAAYCFGAKKLLFLGSSCIYPKLAPQPLKEEYLLSAALEPSNEAYAVAKIAGLKMVQAYRHQYGCDFISVMPTNLYGPNDNYDLQNSHVLPAMLRKFHEAKLAGADHVTLWGSGSPRREFLHVDDLADACLFLMDRYSDERIINIGCGTDVSIAYLAEMVAETVGFKGKIVWDTSMPDGTPRKLLDVSRLFELGWRPSVALGAGLDLTYADFQKSPQIRVAG